MMWKKRRNKSGIGGPDFSTLGMKLVVYASFYIVIWQEGIFKSHYFHQVHTHINDIPWKASFF